MFVTFFNYSYNVFQCLLCFYFFQCLLRSLIMFITLFNYVYYIFQLRFLHFSITIFTFLNCLLNLSIIFIFVGLNLKKIRMRLNKKYGINLLYFNQSRCGLFLKNFTNLLYKFNCKIQMHIKNYKNSIFTDKGN